MGENSWIIDNLNAALNTWNEKLAEIWQLLTQGLADFKGGGVWNVMLNVHSAMTAIGLGLLVLFFAVGVVKTCGSFAEARRPEHALKLFIRFVLAKAAVQYGLELMLAVFDIVQGIVSRAMGAAGTGGLTSTTLPQEIVDKINAVGFWSSIPLWAVTLLGGLFITVLSFVMIMTVYGILVEDIGRLSHEYSTALRVLEFLQDHGAVLICTQSDVRYELYIKGLSQPLQQRAMSKGGIVPW